MIDILSISSEIALMWMLQDLTDDYSTFVQVMASCHEMPAIKNVQYFSEGFSISYDDIWEHQS